MSNVLVIDDSEFDRRMMTRAMKIADGNLRFAEMRGGARIIEAMHQIKPNLVLLDIRMPGISGFEVLKLIKDDDEFRHCKVVIISGSKGLGDRDRARKNGAEAYYSKPYSHTEYIEIAQEIRTRYISEAA